MTTNGEAWHADDEALRGLAQGTTGPVAAASLEAHLMRCETCRAQLNTLALDDSVERTWLLVRATVESPEPTGVERLLQACGMSEETGRLLAAVPAMRGAWLLGVAVVMAFAGLAAAFSGNLGIGLFLLMAPLAPVMGVAAAFGGDADPAQEIVVTAPYSAGRLLLLRATAVLLTSAPIAMLVGLALPGPGWLTIAWLTPAAAGIGLTLALAPLTGLTNAAASIGVVWSTLTLSATRAHDPLVVVDSIGQLTCLTLVVIAAIAIVSKSRILELPRRQKQ